MDAWEWTSGSVVDGRERIDPQILRLIDDYRRIKRISGQVRSIRKARGMSQLDLAKAVGSTQASVSRFESGKLQDVGYLYVRRILDALGVP